MAQITNKGRRWIQHGDNHIILSNNPSITNFQITATIHLPVLSTGDQTVRGPQHSSPTPPIGILAAGSPISITTRATTRLDGIGGTFFTALIRLNGGYGFTYGGATAGPVAVGNIERYDDVANTQTNSSAVYPPSYKCSGYSMNGFGYTSGGENPAGTPINQTLRYDDVIPGTTFIRQVITARSGLTSFAINGFGFTSCGDTSGTGIALTGLTQKLDDFASTQTARTSATARFLLAGFGMNNFGYTSCGETAGPVATGTQQRFDDVANTQTARVTLFAFGARAGFALNGFGFVAKGENPIGANTSVIDEFDDIANSFSGLGVGTAIRLISAYSLNGFGFTTGGFIAAVSGVTERFDHVAFTATAVTSLNTSRSGLTGFATNEYFVNFDTMEP